MVESYERRTSPLKEPRYDVWQKNLMWGCDWTTLRINHIRWYLMILIDQFLRWEEKSFYGGNLGFDISHRSSGP
jgi:hypothetical protein